MTIEKCKGDGGDGGCMLIIVVTIAMWWLSNRINDHIDVLTERLNRIEAELRSPPEDEAETNETNR